MAVRTGRGTAIDECLSIRDGHLAIEDCDAVELAHRFGSPIHVVSEDQLRRNARRFARAFEDAWPDGPVRVLPSLKANHTLALRRILVQEGTGCDTFGASELEAALQAGVPPELVSVNGSSKDAALMERAVGAGCRITLDAARELDLAIRAARRTGRRARIRFRVRPDYEGLEEPSEFHDDVVPIRVAADAYKAGIPTEDLLELGPRALSADEVEVTGLMAHLGRHHHSVEVWGAMAASLADTIARLVGAWDGWVPGEIDIGGGFAAPRDPTGRGVRRRSGASDATTPSVEDYAGAVTSALRVGLRGRGIETEGIALEVEPGRAMFANTGVHLTTVRNVKRQTRPTPRRWVEVDSTEMFLPDGLVERNRWVTIVASRADTGPTQVADVVGISCGFDVITDSAELPDVEPGDVIAFLDTGAYQDAASSNFNALPRPATILVYGGEAEIVKRAETFADVFGRDVIPERLRDRDAGARVLGLDHVSVTCSDIERSLAFYRDLLGLPVLSVGEVSGDDVDRVTGQPGVRMLAADLDLGRGQVLELIEYVAGSSVPPDGATAASASGHVGLLVDDVDEVHRRLVGAGVRVLSEPVRLSEPGAWFGVRCVNAVDPDGVTVELVQRPSGRPRTLRG